MASGPRGKNKAIVDSAPAPEDPGTGELQGTRESRGAWTLSDRRLDRRSTRTVDQILAATIALMLRGGLEKLSISAVCDEAGVSRGTLYRYFSSKADLLDGVTLRLRDRTDEAVNTM